jgi:hypothetical protein
MRRCRELRKLQNERNFAENGKEYNIYVAT